MYWVIGGVEWLEYWVLGISSKWRYCFVYFIVILFLVIGEWIVIRVGSIICKDKRCIVGDVVILFGNDGGFIIVYVDDGSIVVVFIGFYVIGNFLNVYFVVIVVVIWLDVRVVDFCVIYDWVGVVWFYRGWRLVIIVVLGMVVIKLVFYFVCYIVYIESIINWVVLFGNVLGFMWICVRRM